MAKWKLCFVLLLPLTVCLDSEVTIVKTLGSKPDVTPVCTNSTLNIITLIVCKIRTKRNREECRLLYHREKGFEYKCDSRFTFMTKNQTVFLHLSSLTAADSGKYTCECSNYGGTYILHLNVTVEVLVDEDEDASSSTRQWALIGTTIVFTITAVLLGFIYRGLLHSRQPEPLSSLPNMEPGDIEPYSTFIRRESGLYSTVRVPVSNTNMNNSNMFTTVDTQAGNFL